MKITMRGFLLPTKVALTFIILWTLYEHSQLQLGLFLTFFQHPWLTLAIFCLCYLVVVLHAWRWYRLNSAQNIPLSFSRTILPAYIAIAFNNILPGSVGGDFFRLYFVFKKFPAQKSNTLLSIFVDRVIGLLGILVIACVVAPFYMHAFRSNTPMLYLISISITACVACGFIFILVMSLLADETIVKIQNRLSKMKYSGHVLSFLEAIYIYRNAKMVIFESLLVSIATQMILLIVVFITSYTMGLQALPLGVYMLALVIGQIANLVPLTPGGLGVGEAAFANVILMLHPGAAGYATVFFAWRLLSTVAYIPGVFIGVFGFSLLHKKIEIESA